MDKLVKLSDELDFIIFEDRKFADIGECITSRRCNLPYSRQPLLLFFLPSLRNLLNLTTHLQQETQATGGGSVARAPATQPDIIDATMLDEDDFWEAEEGSEDEEAYIEVDSD